METAILGRTGLSVSRLGFGGAPAGLLRYLTPDDRDDPAFKAGVVAALRRAVALGVTYFDVAPGYGDGRAEALFGEALEPGRDRIVLATKFWHHRPWNPADATRRLRESLDRLKTGRVDVLQYHGESFDAALAAEMETTGVLDWLREQRAAGRTRFLGITAEAPSGGLERLIDTGVFDVGLFAYSLIYQSACDYQRTPVGIIPYARARGMGIAVMRPATSGFLQNLLAAELPGATPERITRMALKFVLSTREVDTCVVGMRTAAEVEANAALAADAADRYDPAALHARYV